MSPYGGTDVTQTTTEPTFNHKQLPQDAKVTKSTSGDVDYIFPTQLNPDERKLAEIMLQDLESVLAQSVLDELTARLNANKVIGASLSYLRSLIKRAKTGQFAPEAGVRITAARKEERLEQLRKSVNTPKPTKKNDIPKHLASMHQAIGRQSKTPLNQKYYTDTTMRVLLKAVLLIHWRAC